MKCTKMLGWLVMAAALSFTACSSEDDLAQEQTQQPTQTTTKIHVSVGAGIDNAATRSTVDYNSSTKTRTLKFTVGDKLYIYRDILGDGKLRLTGELTMKDGTLADDGLSATFEGDLRICDQFGQETTYDFGNDDPLTGSTAYLLHEDMVARLYTKQQDGTVAINIGKMVADDVETLMTTALVVTGQYNGSAYQLSTTDTPAPILNCTIAGLTASQTYGFSLYKDGYISTYVEHDTDASGTATFAFANTETGTGHWTLDVEQGGTVVSSIDLGNRELTSKVYNISRYWYGGAMHRLVDLGNVNTSTHPDGLTLQDGDAVTGLLDGKSKSSQRLQISIADGASVILKGVDIQGYKGENFKWAGLTCAGDATIILADGSTNTVNGFYQDYPGIFIAEGKTLTIQGSGSLTATSGGSANPFGAGIGGARNIACGNIVIEGGTVTAKGGTQCAGIGSGYKACGDISISGTANVTATGGGSGAGIGSGKNGSCGTISIEGGTVEAKGGAYGAGIGSGEIASCGNITISGTAHVTAKGGSSGAGIGSGVGISSGETASCCNITIGGSAHVTATGGGSGAGIGSGDCGTVSGTISIEGGTVEATAGSAYSAGIGSGEDGSCGAIVIGSGITQVIAKKIAISSDIDIIGAGYNGTYGTLTIDDVADATTSSTFTNLTSVLTNSDKTWTLTPKNPNP